MAEREPTEPGAETRLGGGHPFHRKRIGALVIAFVHITVVVLADMPVPGARAVAQALAAFVLCLLVVGGGTGVVPRAPIMWVLQSIMVLEPVVHPVGFILMIRVHLRLHRSPDIIPLRRMAMFTDILRVPEAPMGLRPLTRTMLLPLRMVRLLPLYVKKKSRIRPPLLARLDFIGGARSFVTRIGLPMNVKVQLSTRLPDFQLDTRAARVEGVA